MSFSQFFATLRKNTAKMIIKKSVNRVMGFELTTNTKRQNLAVIINTLVKLSVPQKGKLNIRMY